MVSKEEILQQFKDFSLTPDDKSLEKCVEMCLNYDLSAEEIVDTWNAYSLTNLKGEGPTVDLLERMERKEFQKGKESNKKRSIAKPLHEEIYQPSPVRSSVGTPKGNHVPVSRIQTPVQTKRILDESSGIISPGTQSANYASRNGILSVGCTYGPESQFENEKNLELDIKEEQEDCLKAGGYYMYEILRDKANVLNNITEFMANEIMMQNHLTPHEGHLRNYVNKEVVSYGRIVSDCNGKLNNQSVLLEATKRTNLGHCSQLNMSKLSKYSIFPGQTAVVKGTFLQGNKIMVSEMYTDTKMLLPEEPPLTQDSLQMVIACGPFTTQDNLQFEPLKDLLTYVNEHKPHVLLLLGPYYERNNEGIMNGELTQSFDDFFQELMESLMDTVNSDTHVIMVPSSREPHHHPVYPTMPYSMREKRHNLTLLPDPCLVNINGLLVAATTADVLFHISNYEMHLDDRSGPSDRLGRIASHLLKQHCFYPLDPPFKDMCVEHVMLDKYGMIDVKPHVMVLPSNFRHFVKNVEDTLVINPERLTKGVGGGTFAHLEIKAGRALSVCERASCKVVKI